MRVLIINTSERTGGAAIAANRLMESLNNNGVKAKMLVRDKQTERMTVSNIRSSWLLPMKFVWERFIIWACNGFRKRNIFQVDIANTGTDITQTYEFQQADIIHLHWVNQGFLSLTDLKKILQAGKPVVITLHDMWYFTGICHYSAGCRQYETQCTKCPLLTNGGWFANLAQRVYDSKLTLYKERQIAFVGCSQWITSLAESSLLTHGHYVTSIPNAINTNMFKPADKLAARRKHGLPTNGLRLILFSSQRITDERKGFKYLAEACNIIKQRNPELAENVAVVVVGSESEKVKKMLSLSVYPIDFVSSEQEITELYNAVDLFLTPSLQDNLPNAIVEAMACGTPCVGFRTGGIPEMIDHKQNGYVANYTDADDLAYGIEWCLDPTRYDELCTAAHTKAVHTYSEDRVARRYTEVYERMLNEQEKDENS